MQQGPPDLHLLGQALDDADVRYVLVGGLALILHGGSYATFDADLAIAFDRENRTRIVEALRRFNPRPSRLADGAAWVWDEFCVRAPWTIWQTDIGRIDILVQLPGLDSFQGLFERSQVLDVGGMPWRVAALEDLIAMKSVADRPKDRLHLMELLAIQRERDSAA